LSSDYRSANIHKEEKEKINQFLSYGKSDSKKLPVEMMRTTKETCRDFLSFILAAEGGITRDNGQFEFSSKSVEFAQQVKLLLLRFGIQSNLSNGPASYKDKNGEKVDCGIRNRLYINNLKDQMILLKELTYFWPKNKI